ncbi:hypothetical protein [Psychrobacter alimentarius]|uniref:hypothetical protein n=1 Tax=Psychrobacter alimentarius TaxID=261164 RepID=UPI001918CB65|nr:hypothetical protein [Psychrobacter alimentarius]
MPTAISIIISTSANAQGEQANANFAFNPQATSLTSDRTEKSEAQIDWSVMITAHSPTQPIAKFLDDWGAPLDSGKLAYTQGRTSFEIRPADSAISYGLGWRYDYLLRFSEETAEVYWQYENKKPSSTSQTYPLFLEAQHNERVGANIGFTKQVLPNWQLTTRANIWQGLHALDGKIVGDLSTRVLPDSEVTNIRDSLDKTDAYIDYYYDEPALGEEDLGWHPAKPSGYGYSLDLQLIGKLSDDTQLALRGYDVLGRMHWKDMPSTRYTLDYDANGRPLYSIEGQLTTNDVTQALPWRFEGTIQHQLDNRWQIGAHGQVNDIQDLYQLSVGYQALSDTYPLTITGLIEPQTQALGVALDSHYGGIKLLTDSLDSEKAKRSEISLYGRYSW